MSTDPSRLERRARQRFEVHLPISILVDGINVPGFTQDVSARGVFLYAETVLQEGSAVELTFTMPSDVTLTESMRVRCRGHVTRCGGSAGQRHGIAVYLDSYEYLPECDSAPELVRVSSEAAPESSPALPR